MNAEQPEPRNPATNGAAVSEMVKQMNWPTVILVLLTGGGNFFATKQFSGEREYQIQQAVRQIGDLHQAVDDFEKRQKDTVAKVTQALDNQAQVLKNQATELEHLTSIITQLHRLHQNYGNPEL